MEKMMSEGSIPLGFSQNLVSESNPPVQKKKRNLPGNPDPEAEVIALSPKTLMATNRFVCEVCGKGFQRDQNLQLHRRGHNLPWKLKQRSNKEAVRKRVYVCPETSCVHNHPSRALGDLTGIKKHFCRKHGEKKHKCDKCSKWYAVRSDWKAHSKTCGTREYRCDCGSIFSRRDSFITHRAFCEALAEETAKLNATSQFNTFSPTTNINIHHPHFMGTPLFLQPNTPQNHFFPLINQIDHKTEPTQTHQPGSLSFWLSTNQVSQPHNNHTFIQNHNNNNNNIHGFGSLPEPDPFLSSSSSHSISSLYSKQHQIPICQTDLSSAQHSATALLQKAAQIGAASSTGFGGFKINDGGKLGCDELFGSSSIVTCMGSDDRETGNSNQEFGANAAKRRRLMDGGNRDGDGGKTRDFLGVHEICHPPSINGWL